MPVVSNRIQRQIRGDPEHPGGEFRTGRVVLARAVDAEKYFLGQILRDGRIPHHPVEKIDKGNPVLAEQKLEGLFIPGFYVQHQLDVGPCHSLHTLFNPCRI